MRVLVACEESQVVCKAFRARGHEAYSCDILPCSGEHPEWHIQSDFRDLLSEVYFGRAEPWDLLIAHPPCTYLCNSGVRWLFNKDGSANYNRMAKCHEGHNLFWDCLTAYPKIANAVCVENPIPHKYAKLPDYTQIIQPWQFGHGETKATCLWLKNLPKLVPTNIVSGRDARIHKMAPGPERSRLRSVTYTGIAEAMATQWGNL